MSPSLCLSVSLSLCWSVISNSYKLNDVGKKSTYKLKYVGKCYTILLCVGAPILGLGVLILDAVYIFMFFLFL